ncbi:MAG: FAD-binding oxidoreductase [Acidobacteria bacterium]|nr:FAD-binding oxidoreductase [Acidobacteriota bacterium]
MAVGGDSDVCRPTSAEQVADAMAAASQHGIPLGLRGAGQSYGDAALNSDGRLLDLCGMNTILNFDPETGIAIVEPGVTIRQLWRLSIEHGWWPPVVPGTMHVSCGGAAAMNIHGKNNFAVGPFGEYVRSFKLMAPGGEVFTCSREQNADVFYGAIAGFGMLGCFLELELQLKKVYSGRLRVTAITTPDLESNLELMEENVPTADYLVGWIDCHARGRALGRGLLHRADQMQQGQDAAGEQMLTARQQDLPSRILGVMPKGWCWPMVWCIVHGGMLRYLNAAKYKAGVREAGRSPRLETHGAFHFLLDYIPNWKKALLPGGLIQFQPFVPKDQAARVFRTILETSQDRGLSPYLGVLKRHRQDRFLMTHAVNGFSLALDFAVTKANRDRLWRLCQELAEVVLEASGRFYYAKDAVLLASSHQRIHGLEAISQFTALKQRLDPKGLLQTDLSRRICGA